MKKTTFFLLAFLACCMASAQLTVTETVFDRKANEDKFAFGADISWLSQQESWGTYYCNRQGKRADLMDILKEDFGLNAVRFRVWVNPSGGWSGKQDVINLCKRAYAKGLKIMISFHYSDTWADSSNQTIPGQWTDHSAEALAQKVYEHTKDVLSGLKKEGIIPKWVSIGNETKYGMLYETGRTKTTEGMMNFVKFINSGAKAVKEISEDIITIIHLPNAHDEGTARNMFDNLKKYGANYDCIGLSAYPRWSHLDVTTDANITSTINKYLTTFKNLKSRFGKPVMVMETGHYANEPYDANRFLAEFMKALITDGELGCFYWEPEAFDNSGYNLGAWSSATHQATIAMDAYMGIKHTKVSKYATSLLMLPNDTLIFKPGEKVDMKVYAKTTTNVTHVENVDFYLNKKKAASLKYQEKSSNYIFSTDTLPTGIYAFNAVVFDNQNHSQSTDTISFLVGDVKVIQETDPGFVGYPDSIHTPLEKSIKSYTGGAYVPASSTKKEALAWDVNFPAAGTYTFYFRYHTPTIMTTLMTVGTDKKVYVSCAVTPQSKWGYVKKEVEITEPGLQRVCLQGVTRGLPDIDFLAIALPEGVEDVTTGIAEINAPSLWGNYYSGLGSEAAVYDLMGRIMLSGNRTIDGTSNLPQGIFVMNGKKVYVR